MTIASWLERRHSELRQLRRASRESGAGVLVGACRFADLTLRQRYSPKEVFALGLLDGRLTRDPDAAISNERLLQMQRVLNAEGDPRLTEDKLVFQERCHATDLAVPALLAVAGPGPVRLHSIPRFESLETLAAAICEPRWPSIVLKPVHGVHGRGVLALSCSSGSGTAPDGRQFGPDELVEHMHAAGFENWLVQRRLPPHGELTAVTGASALSTCRVTTLVGRSGDVEILYARLRLAAPGASIDNFSAGTTGNIVTNVSLATGRVTSAILPRPGGIGFDLIDRHPISGHALLGWPIPLFTECMDLVRRAAEAFLPLRTVGWDVALSSEGVSLVEGNCYWDAPNLVGSLAPIVGKLRAALPSR